MKRLWAWLLALDRILRGETTRVADLRTGSIEIPVVGISVVLIILGVIYGACMGTYAVVNYNRGMQMVASMVKVPALFLLTLAVTLPSLYVLNALVGSRLTASSLVRLFIAALAVNLAVLSSLGPIVAFFSVNTTSYSFMVLLNVVVFAISGLLGMVFLLQTLNRLNIALRPEPKPSDEPAAASSPEELVAAEVVPSAGQVAPGQVAPGPLDRLEGHMLGRHVRTVFGLWMLVFGLVGAQMSWVLRPFIGVPSMPFEWFRPRGSNFFEAVIKSLAALLG